MSFGPLDLAQRLKQNNVLMKIDALIDWGALRPMLTGLYKRELSNGGGQEPFDALWMLKAIGHSLSDAALEQALCARIDFLHFCSLSLSDAIPDEATVCRFRNCLVINDRLDGLLVSINAQIQSHGLMVKGMTGAMIDVTLIESAVRPEKTITLEGDAEGKTVLEDGSQPGITCIENKVRMRPGSKKVRNRILATAATWWSMRKTATGTGCIPPLPTRAKWRFSK